MLIKGLEPASFYYAVPRKGDGGATPPKAMADKMMQAYAVGKRHYILQYIYNKQIGIAFIETIKAIPAKVFGKWGVGKRTFVQKGFFPTEQFFNNLFPEIHFYLGSDFFVL